MKNRPGIFVSLVLGITIMTSLVGLVVFQNSQSEVEIVKEKDRQYMAEKSAQNNPQQATSQDFVTEVAQQIQTTKVISVYFSKTPDSDNSPERVFAVDRYIEDEDLKDAAVNKLIEGPSDTEKATGFYGGLILVGESNCEGQNFSLTVMDGLARLHLCKEKVSIDETQNKKEINQVVATLRQFEGINEIEIIGNDGTCLFTSSSSAVCSN